MRKSGMRRVPRLDDRNGLHGEREAESKIALTWGRGGTTAGKELNF